MDYVLCETNYYMMNAKLSITICLISHSVAILQYIADKYKKDDKLYPADLQKRAVVNHRLAFHLSTYYKAVANYMVRFNTKFCGFLQKG